MKYTTNKLDRILLALFIFFIPVMINNPACPILPEPIGGRIQISELIFAVLFTAWFLGFLAGRYRMEQREFNIPILFYLIAAFLSIVNSYSKLNAGLEFIGQLYLAAIFFVIISMIKNREDLDFALSALIISTSFVIIIGFISLVLVGIFGVNFPVFFKPAYSGSDFPYIGSVIRVRSTLLPTTKMLANYLILTLGLLASRLLAEKRKILRNILLTMLVAGILIFFFTVSRDITGFLFAIAVFLFMFQARENRRIIVARKAVFIAALLIFVAVNLVSIIYVDSFYVSHGYEKGFKLKSQAYSYPELDKGIGRVDLKAYYTFDHYFWLKKAAWRIFLKYPLIGSGLDNFIVDLRELVHDGAVPPRLIRHESSQSTAMTILAERGIIGFASLLVIWTAVLLFLIRLWRCSTPDAYFRNIIAAFTAGTIGILINSINVDVMNFRFLWLVFALIFAYGNIALKERGQYE